MNNIMSLNQIIKVGKPRLIVEKIDDEGLHYKIEATILPYNKQKVREGYGIWFHTNGVSKKTEEQLKASLMLYPASVYFFEGEEKDFPYEKE